jgi:hypothetical protein
MIMRERHRFISGLHQKQNKTRHATTSSRSVEMIFRNYNPNPVRNPRRCYQWRVRFTFSNFGVYGIS